MSNSPRLPSTRIYSRKSTRCSQQQAEIGGSQLNAVADSGSELAILDPPPKKIRPGQTARNSKEREDPEGGQPDAAELARPQSNLEVINDGKCEKVDSMLLKRATAQDRATAAFVTWSAPRSKTGVWNSPGERKTFAQMIAQTVDDLNAGARPGPQSATAIACAVFREKHQNGEYHLHAVLSSNGRTSIWAALGEGLRQKYRAPCDVRVGMGQGADHLSRMLKYTMVPTVTKSDLDTAPFLSPNFKVPHQVRVDPPKKEKTPSTRQM